MQQPVDKTFVSRLIRFNLGFTPNFIFNNTVQKVLNTQSITKSLQKFSTLTCWVKKIVQYLVYITNAMVQQRVGRVNSLSRNAHTATRIKSLPRMSYQVPYCGGVIYETDRMKSEYTGWQIRKIHLGKLDNPNSKPMVHMGLEVPKGTNRV